MFMGQLFKCLVVGRAVGVEFSLGKAIYTQIYVSLEKHLIVEI